MGKQQGSAHVIIVVVLVAALLGALGFIFWQNFLKEDDAKSETKTSQAVTEKEEVEAKPTTKTYTGSSYSFEYPDKGWLVVEIRNDYDPTNAVNPEVRTDDYSPNVGMGVDYGAVVSVYTTAHTIGTDIQEDKRATMMSLPDMKDVQDITVDGVPAYSYSSGYEGMRYTTSVIHEGTYYQIVYKYAGDDQSVHRDGYDTIVKSFNFR